MTLKLLPPALVYLFLSLIAIEVKAQEPKEVVVSVNEHQRFRNAPELGKYQLGVDVGRPVAMPLGLIKDWQKVLPLEAVFQYRVRELPTYLQIYGGYFQGTQHYENGSELIQNGFHLKTGLLFVVSNKGIRHNFTMEGNLLMSLGKIDGRNTFKGPVFGDHEAAASFPVESFGAEIGFGADIIRLGSYKLKAVTRILMCSLPEHDVSYIPGVGYTGFMGLGFGANFYLMHAWGDQSK